MKMLFVFLFCLFFGVFDYLIFFWFFGLIFFGVFFTFFDFSFYGVFFCDFASFFLIYLSLLIFFYCFFCNFFDKWLFNFYFNYSFFLLCVFFFVFLSFLVYSIFFFYILFEVIFVFLFFFVLMWGYSPERLQASFYMVFYTIVVSFPFFIYFTLSESEMFFLKFGFFSCLEGYWSFFLFFVFLIKLPVYGLHLWLPKAHVEAPVSGSMVLAGVLLKLGGYGLYRFFFLFSKFSFGELFFFMGLLGGLFSCFLCFRQFDFKAFVAYSSICHMGIFLCGFSCFNSYGFFGGFYMLVAHGFCSSLLFYMLFFLYGHMHTRSLFLIKGLFFLFPVFSFFIFIVSIFNMGFPPSFSFFSEVSISVGVFSYTSFLLFFLFVFLFLGGVYSLFFFVLLSHGQSLLVGSFSVSVRDYFLFCLHLFPLLILPFFLDLFF